MTEPFTDWEQLALDASQARNIVWGYHRTLTREQFERTVRHGANDPALRAAVQVVHAAAYRSAVATIAGYGVEATLRAKIADELTRQAEAIGRLSHLGHTMLTVAEHVRNPGNWTELIATTDTMEPCSARSGTSGSTPATRRVSSQINPPGGPVGQPSR